MIGANVSVSMGELRSIRVFVLGDAQRPGSYTVSSLSTITNALFASGGVKPIGSLRNIELKRHGELVSRLDLYDLLLRGDTRGDARRRDLHSPGGPAGGGGRRSAPPRRLRGAGRDHGGGPARAGGRAGVVGL